MNFQEFQTHRAAQLAADPTLIDLAETNLWHALADLVPTLSTNEMPHLHRCHLAQAWLATFGLPETWAGRALVSSGVRHSLSMILPILAQRGVQLRLTEDVYPVYGQLARAAGLDFQAFPTLPLWESPHDGDCLLLPNPLKPAGRWLMTHEVSALQEWLASDGRRRLLLDAVYTFDTQLHPTTLALLETNQTILLHSLSKGWLHPQVFGVALVPETDLDDFTAVFRENSPSQVNLLKARQLLDHHAFCPKQVAAALATRREQLLTRLPEQVRSQILQPRDAESAGYLIAIRAPQRQLLEQHHLLTIPLSVFGSSHQDCSVLSTLTARAKELTSPRGPSQSRNRPVPVSESIPPKNCVPVLAR